MPVQHTIDARYNLVYTEFSGDVVDDDFREHLNDLRADAQFEPTMPELVDLRRVSTVSVASGMVTESARWMLHAPSARRAVVAPTDVLFGLSRMYQTYLLGDGAERFGVYRTLEPALEWLDLPPTWEPPPLPPSTT